MTKKSRELVESVAFDSKTRIDKEKGVVYGVRILGPISEHGYRYTQNAMKNAIPLYEGKPVNLNHPRERSVTSSRRYEDRFGRIRNVTFKEGGNDYGLYGDLHYNQKHQVTGQFEWDVENAPDNLGLSHMAKGSTVARGSKIFVEAIDVVKSVDLVADPATNRGLFEDKGGRRMKVKKRRKNRSREDLIEDLRDRIEETGDDELVDLLEAVAPAEEETPKAATPQEAMAKMIEAVFMDGDLDLEQKRTKINAILDLAADEEADGDTSSTEGKKETKEEEIPEDRGGSVKNKNGKATKKKNGDAELIEDVADVKEELQTLKKERRVLELCEDAGFRPSSIQKRALMGLSKVSEVKDLIESFAGTEDRKTARGKAKSGERRDRHDDKDVDLKEFAESLTGGSYDVDDDD